MTIRMSNLERLTLVEMEEFVTTSRQATWSAVEPGSVYRLIERALKAQQYRRLSKSERGIVKRFLGKVTALEPSPTDATDPALDGYATDREEAGASPELSPPLQRRRHRVAGRGGCGARESLGTGSGDLCQQAWEVFGNQQFQQGEQTIDWGTPPAGAESAAEFFRVW